MEEYIKALKDKIRTLLFLVGADGNKEYKLGTATVIVDVKDKIQLILNELTQIAKDNQITCTINEKIFSEREF